MVNLTDLATIMGVDDGVVNSYVSDLLTNTESTLYKAVNGALSDSMDAVGARKMDEKAIRRVERTITFRLNDHEQKALNAMFTEFVIDLKPTELANSRMLRAVAYMAKEAVYSSLSDTMRVVEYSSDFMASIFRGRANTHVCVPCSRALENSNMLQELARLRALLDLTSITDTLRKKIKDFYDHRTERMCDEPSRCNLSADVLIFDHLLHDVPVTQVATVMAARNIPVAYGYFLYTKDFERRDEGIFGDTDIMYKITRDKRGRRDKLIVYSAELGLNIEHDYESYMALLHSTSLSIAKKKEYDIEIYDQRCGVLYFYCMTDISACPGLKGSTRMIWDKQAIDSLMIRSYRLKRHDTEGLIHGNHLVVNADDYRSYEPFTFLVPKNIVHQGIRFGTTLDITKVSREAIYDRINDYNSRIIVNGADVTCPKRKLNPEELRHLSMVIFALVFEIRQDEAIVQKYLKGELRDLTVLSQASITGLIFRAMYVYALTGVQCFRDWVTNGMHQSIIESHLVNGLTPTVSDCGRYDSYSKHLVINGRNYKDVVAQFNVAVGKSLVIKALVHPGGFLDSIRKSLSGWKAMGLIEQSHIDQIELRIDTTDVPVETERSYRENVNECADFQRRAATNAIQGDTVIYTGREAYIPYVAHHDDYIRAVPQHGNGEVAGLLKRKIADDISAPPTNDTVLETCITYGSAQDYVDNARPARVTNVLETLQCGYDEIFPGAGIGDRYYDSANVNDSDLSINVTVPRMRMSTAKVGNLKAQESFKPNLRTSASHKRPKAVKETLIGLKKRNFNTPAVEEPIMFIDSMNRAYEKFFRKFCKKNWKQTLKYYQSKPIIVTEENISLWTSKLDSDDKRERLRKLNFTVEQKDIDRYNLMVKSNLKVKAESGAEKEYQGTQTVVFHDPDKNGYWCPLFMEIFVRLLAMLKPNVAVNIRKNYDDIQRFLNIYEPRNAAVWYMENDFSKYDKSQQWRALYTEWGMYELMGISLIDLQQWRNGHIIRTVISSELGLKLVALLQRCSGDATTTLGNTIVNMVSVADIYEFEHFYYAFFIGDDSVVCLYKRIQDDQITSMMGGKYNLIAKAYCTQQGYFCSSYIVRTPNGIKFMRDPVKVVEKLSQCDTAKEELLHEKWVSLNDTMRSYCADVNLDCLNIAVQIRTKCGDIKSMLRGLYSVLVDYTSFRSLYTASATYRAF